MYLPSVLSTDYPPRIPAYRSSDANQSTLHKSLLLTTCRSIVNFGASSESFLTLKVRRYKRYITHTLIETMCAYRRCCRLIVLHARNYLRGGPMHQRRRRMAFSPLNNITVLAVQGQTPCWSLSGKVSSTDFEARLRAITPRL